MLSLNAEARLAARNPTQAQKEAGNYRKGHVSFHGLDIAIESARGSYRRGADRNGKPWQVRMPDHYGYIKRTEGADGDHVDVYLGPHEDSRSVFIVDQCDAVTKRFDEHKVMLGYRDRAGALAAYRAAFSDGRGADRCKAVTATDIDGFKEWLRNGDQGKPMKRAMGGRTIALAAGGAAQVPWFVKQQASQMRAGPLRSPVGGRTDHLPISVKSGSHVLPADVVSALGQGNTDNGFQVLGKMFPAAKTPRMPMRLGKGFAEGGDVAPEGEGVDILAAGGEHVLDPGQVTEVGAGDPQRGHAILDAFIKHVRDENIRTLRKLPGPARK